LAAIEGFLMMGQRYKINKNEPNKFGSLYHSALKMLLPLQMANDIAHTPEV
jgi:hypothetical protein